jgi:hypothetical protein
MHTYIGSQLSPKDSEDSLSLGPHLVLNLLLSPNPLLSPLELPEVLYRRDCEHVAAQPTRADHRGWNRGSRAGTDTVKGRPT